MSPSSRPTAAPRAPSDEPVASPAPLLSSAQRSALRSQAHALSPVVMVGDAGLTPAVLEETRRALASHGLIKVRVQGDDRQARLAIGERLSQELGCALVQSIGKMLVLWRAPEATAPAQAPIRRRVVTPPKKLAAEGKAAAPARRSRPASPPAQTQPVPTRLRPPPRAARVMGPGSRTARGALDASIKPVGRQAEAAARPAEGAKRPSTRKPQPVGLNAPARAPSGSKPRSPARSTTGKAASGARTAPASKSTRGPRSVTSGSARSSGTARPGSRSRGPRRGP